MYFVCVGILSQFHCCYSVCDLTFPRNLELHKGEIEELMKQKDRELKNLVLSSNAEKQVS